MSYASSGVFLNRTKKNQKNLSYSSITSLRGNVPTQVCKSTKKLNEELRSHIQRLKSELEMERLKSKQIYKDKVFEVKKIKEEYDHSKSTKLKMIKDNEISRLKETFAKQKELELKQIIKFKDEEMRILRHTLMEEKESAIKDLQKKIPSNKPPVNNDIEKRLNQQIDDLKKISEKLEEKSVKNSLTAEERNDVIKKMKGEHEREIQRILREARREQSKSISELREMRKSLGDIKTVDECCQPQEENIPGKNDERSSAAKEKDHGYSDSLSPSNVVQRKMKELKKRNTELVEIAKKLECKAKKSQSELSEMKNARMNEHMEYVNKDQALSNIKKTLAIQRAKDLADHAHQILQKDKLIDELKRQLLSQREVCESHSDVEDIEKERLETKHIATSPIQWNVNFDTLASEMKNQNPQVANAEHLETEYSSLKEELNKSELELTFLKKNLKREKNECTALSLSLMKKESELSHLSKVLKEKDLQNMQLLNDINLKSLNLRKLEEDITEMRHKVFSVEKMKVEQRDLKVEFDALQEKCNGLEYERSSLKEEIGLVNNTFRETFTSMELLEKENGMLREELKERDDKIRELIKRNNQGTNSQVCTQTEERKCHDKVCQTDESHTDIIAKKSIVENELIADQAKNIVTDNDVLESEGIPYSEQDTHSLLENASTLINDLAVSDSECHSNDIAKEKLSLLSENENLTDDRKLITSEKEGKFRLFTALYTYDPTVYSPNEDHEEELAFNADDKIYVYGEMDEDGFYMAELKSGQRGLVPSNLVQLCDDESSFEMSEDDYDDFTGVSKLVAKAKAEDFCDIGQDNEILCQDTESQDVTINQESILQLTDTHMAYSEAKLSQPVTDTNDDLNLCELDKSSSKHIENVESVEDPLSEEYLLKSHMVLHSTTENLLPSDSEMDNHPLMSEREDEVSFPLKVHIERQLQNSLLVAWQPPNLNENETVKGYVVYVNGTLKQTVLGATRTKTLLSDIDLNQPTQLSLSTILQDSRQSDPMKAVIAVGKDVSLAPYDLQITNIATTSAELHWKPSCSSYTHVVFINDHQSNVVLPSCYTTILRNLLPGTEYNVKVHARLYAQQINSNNCSSSVSFKTLYGEVPEPPFGVCAAVHDKRILLSWIPVVISDHGTSNGSLVTGYRVYSGTKCLAVVESAIADSIEIDWDSCVKTLHVRTQSMCGESRISNSVNLETGIDEDHISKSLKCGEELEALSWDEDEETAKEPENLTHHNQENNYLSQKGQRIVVSTNELYVIEEERESGLSGTMNTFSRENANTPNNTNLQDFAASGGMEPSVSEGHPFVEIANNTESQSDFVPASEEYSMFTGQSYLPEPSTDTSYDPVFKLPSVKVHTYTEEKNTGNEMCSTEVLRQNIFDSDACIGTKTFDVVHITQQNNDCLQTSTHTMKTASVALLKSNEPSSSDKLSASKTVDENHNQTYTLQDHTTVRTSEQLLSTDLVALIEKDAQRDLMEEYPDLPLDVTSENRLIETKHAVNNEQSMKSLKDIQQASEVLLRYPQQESIDVLGPSKMVSEEDNEISENKNISPTNLQKEKDPDNTCAGERKIDDGASKVTWGFPQDDQIEQDSLLSPSLCDTVIVDKNAQSARRLLNFQEIPVDNMSVEEDSLLNQPNPNIYSLTVDDTSDSLVEPALQIDDQLSDVISNVSFDEDADCVAERIIRDSHSNETENNHNDHEIMKNYLTQSTFKEGNSFVNAANDSLDELSPRVRVFVALYDYDPITMSPNIEDAADELAFSVGDFIRIIGEVDEDGFYMGHLHGLSGLVPSNMVKQVVVNDDNMAKEVSPVQNTKVHSPQLLDNKTRSADNISHNKFEPEVESLSSHCSSMPDLSHQVELNSDGDEPQIMMTLYSYDPHLSSPNVDSENELSFSAGEIALVYGEMDEDGFFTGVINGKKGLIPSNFVRPATPREARKFTTGKGKKKISFLRKSKKIFFKLKGK